MRRYSSQIPYYTQGAHQAVSRARIRGAVRRRRCCRVVLLCVVLALTVVAACIVYALCETAQKSLFATGGLGAAVEMNEGSSAQASTPRSEWRQGSVPLLLQTDPAWAHEPFAGSDIKTAGCGPTCMGMVYVCLTGATDKGPLEMARLCERGGYVMSGMTSWTYMTEGARELGLSAQELPADAARLSEVLRAGRPVIASMRPGNFTTEGHFIVLCGIDEAGNVEVRDPNSAQRSSRVWPVDTILSECANLWAYELA